MDLRSLDLDSLSEDELLELNSIITVLENHDKYNAVEKFEPYDYQLKFFEAGNKYKRRFLLAGNRLGKTYSAAAEISYHLTGRYPQWWPGYRFTKPIRAWAIGITGESTQKVLQKEIFGTESAKYEPQIGTGSLPKSCIIEMTKDGQQIKTAKIKHVSGGASTLEFRSTNQGESVLMGSSVDYILLDEEDAFRSEQIYAQCCTRTMTTNGLVTITATPENK